MNDTSIKLLKSNLTYQQGERDRLTTIEWDIEQQLERTRLERRHCEDMIRDLEATLEGVESAVG